jgi:NAD(P)-dependent dehydrogenase (short-subunit alcohol dehydrogenase family)
MDEMKPLHGKVALVTGGSRGTGRAIALELAGLGADVAVTARTVVASDDDLPGTIGETAAAMEAMGVRSLAIAADMKNPAEVTKVVTEVLDAFGRCDILVNNASDTGENVFKDFWQTPPEVWNGQIQLNVNAMYGLMWGFAPGMKANGGGYVINIGSAKEPPGQLVPGGMRMGGGDVRIGATYLTSKVAIYAMSSFVANHLAEDNIVVTCVNPGGAASETHYHHMKLLGMEAHPTPMAMPVKTVAYIVTCDNPMEQFAGRYISAVQFAQDKGLATLADP